MGSFKRPRVFDPLDLEIIDLVYEAASAQLAARHPPSNPDEESVRQEALKKLVFRVMATSSHGSGYVRRRVPSPGSSSKGWFCAMLPSWSNAYSLRMRRSS
jgi:hypothetical protein